MDIQAIWRIKVDGRLYKPSETVTNIPNDEGERLIRIGAAIKIEHADPDEPAVTEKKATTKKSAKASATNEDPGDAQPGDESESVPVGIDPSLVPNSEG